MSARTASTGQAISLFLGWSYFNIVGEYYPANTIVGSKAKDVYGAGLCDNQ